MWTVPCLSCFCGTEGWSQGSTDASQVVLPPGCIPRLSFYVQTLALRIQSTRWKRMCIASLATLGALGTLINVIKVTFLVSSRFFKVQHFHVFVCFCHCIYLCCKCAAFYIIIMLHFASRDKCSLCSPSWPWTHCSLTASTSWGTQTWECSL